MPRILTLFVAEFLAQGVIMGTVSAQEAEGSDTRLFGVRVVKASPGLTGKTPLVSFPGFEGKCHVGGYRGENRHEFYFDVEVDKSVGEPPTVKFECDGVEVRCVWVGHTRVKFKKVPGGVTFPLLFDGHNPYALHMNLRDVPGVLLYYMHKPRDRASGPYRDVPWPEAAIAAEGNLMFAAMEVFRDMKIGEAAGKEFDGYVAIGGFETTFPRVGRGPGGHSDYPPHFHLFLVVPPGWRIREASHIYIDNDGRLTGRVVCNPSLCEGRSRTYETGMLCAQKDFKDRVAFEFRIEQNGSLMIRRKKGAIEYHIRPEPTTRSFKSGARVYKGDKLLCEVLVRDNCVSGEMRIRRTFVHDGTPDVREEVIRYDPDTAKILSRSTQ